MSRKEKGGHVAELAIIIGLDVVFASKADKDKIGERKKAVQNKKNNFLFILSQRDS